MIYTYHNLIYTELVFLMTFYKLVLQLNWIKIEMRFTPMKNKTQHSMSIKKDICVGSKEWCLQKQLVHYDAKMIMF